MASSRADEVDGSDTVACQDALSKLYLNSGPYEAACRCTVYGLVLHVLCILPLCCFSHEVKCVFLKSTSVRVTTRYEGARIDTAVRRGVWNEGKRWS